MTTIGNTTIESSTFAVAADRNVANQHYCAVGFTVATLFVYVQNDFIATEYLKLGLYDSTATTPTDLLGETAAIEGAGVAGWYSADLITPVVLSGGNFYWLSVLSDAAFTMRYKAGVVPYYRQIVDTYSDGFLDPWSGGGNSIRTYSIYGESAIGAAGGQAGILLTIP